MEKESLLGTHGGAAREEHNQESWDAHGHDSLLRNSGKVSFPEPCRTEVSFQALMDQKHQPVAPSPPHYRTGSLSKRTSKSLIFPTFELNWLDLNVNRIYIHIIFFLLTEPLFKNLFNKYPPRSSAGIPILSTFILTFSID